MYAVIENGGKQYRVSEGDVIETEKLGLEDGSKVSFPAIMLADGETVLTGAEAAAVTVTAKVLAHGKGKKIVVFKYKPKKNIRKKIGHRQQFTKLQIESIKK